MVRLKLGGAALNSAIFLAILFCLMREEAQSAELEILTPTRHEQIAGTARVRLGFSDQIYPRTKSLTLLIDNVPIGSFTRARRELSFDSTPLRKGRHNLKVYAFANGKKLLAAARVPIVAFTHNPGSPALPKLWLTAKQVRASSLSGRPAVKTKGPRRRGTRS